MGGWRGWVRARLERGGAQARLPRLRRQLRRVEAKIARIDGAGGMAPAKIGAPLAFCLFGAGVFAVAALTRQPGSAGGSRAGRRPWGDFWATLKEAALPDLLWVDPLIGWGLWGLCAGALLAAVSLWAGKLSWRHLEPAEPGEMLSLEQAAARHRARVEQLELEACAKAASARGRGARL